MTDRSVPLSPTESYFVELYSAGACPYFVISQEIGMDASRQLIQTAKACGSRVTYVQLLVRAAALALARTSPEHSLPDGDKRLIPGTVDVTLPVGGSGVRNTPVSMHIMDAAGMNLQQLGAEMLRQAEELRKPDPPVLQRLRRLAPLLRIGWLRRFAVGKMVNSVSWRRKHMGTLQVTCVPEADFGLAMTAFAGTLVGLGSVKQRPAVVDGELCVRWSAWISGTFDHRIWEGLGATKFMKEIQRILESGELESEIEPALVGKSSAGSA